MTTLTSASAAPAPFGSPAPPARSLTVGPPGLLLATALVVCVLFALEDPTVVATRQHLRGGTAERWWTNVGIDVALALTMLAYNVAASRLVVRTAGAASVMRAADELAAEARHRTTVARRLDPFRLTAVAADHLGAALARASDWATRRRHRRVAGVVGDLARVNVLGVPGATLDRVRRGERVTRRTSARDTVLFVASWFAGAWCIERIVVTVEDVPVAGELVTRTVVAIGTTFSTLTDLTRVPGQIVVVTVVALVVRHAVRVERRARGVR